MGRRCRYNHPYGKLTNMAHPLTQIGFRIRDGVGARLGSKPDAGGVVIPSSTGEQLSWITYTAWTQSLRTASPKFGHDACHLMLSLGAKAILASLQISEQRGRSALRRELSHE